MNRSILFSLCAFVCTAVPLALVLANEPGTSAGATSADDDKKQRAPARQLSPEKCRQLREQVHQAQQERVGAALGPASAPGKEENAR